MPERQPLDTWAVVEIMGHERAAGHVTEEVFGGACMFRVDVPETEQNGRKTEARTEYIGVASVFRLTPCTEEAARVIARQIEYYRPPSLIDLHRTLPSAEEMAPAVVELEWKAVELEDDDDPIDELWEWEAGAGG